MNNNYDVIIVGGGHAGCEAAHAAARLGAKTLLLTGNMDHIAQMSCNPAIGGVAKGQVTREIDALGGVQARVTDAAMIQFRMLNRTKGPAVWSPRAQCDKVCFQRAMKFELERLPGLDIHQAEVTELWLDNGRVSGVVTEFGDRLGAAAVVLATGTFLKGKLHYGPHSVPGGRAGDPPSNFLSDCLRGGLGLRMGRLKTGTPPRILAKTIDFSKMERQDAEEADEYFSFFPDPGLKPRSESRDMSCYMTNSTGETAEIVRRNLVRSPMYGGEKTIDGIGTRYCPSFEDKVVRFPHHERHLLFLEPEGEFTGEYYINGISTSLPVDVQVEMIHSVPGLEKAVIARYAYAIEYDLVFPDQIDRSLRVKKWPNLFLAGQINGTSGYEEAAGQGLVAGMNAARLAAGRNTLELSRESSYIGVMIDDLVTKEIIEPYRLFTSRAEYRLRLRQDNADLRLCGFAAQHGLLSKEKSGRFEDYRQTLDSVRHACLTRKSGGKSYFEQLKVFRGIYSGETPPFETTAFDIPEKLETKVWRQLVIEAHYEGYLKREESTIAKMRQMEDWRIPEGFDYDAIKGLRNEARAKLKAIAPTTLAQAGRIDCVTPAETALLQVHLKRLRG